MSTYYNIEELKDDSAEKLFCEPFVQLKKYNPHPAVEEFVFFSSLLEDGNPFSTDKNIRDAVNNYSEQLKDEFMYKVIEKRQQMYQYKLDNTGIVVLMMLSNNLGTMAMLMMYLQYQCFKQNCLGATLNANKVYDLLGNGVPTDSDLEHLWYSTKVKSDKVALASDNLVDYVKFAKSFYGLDN